MLLTLVGAVLGLATGLAIAWLARSTTQQLGAFYVPVNDVVLGLFIAILFGLIATALPAREIIAVVH